MSDDPRVGVIRSLLRSYGVHHFVEPTGQPWWCVLPAGRLSRADAVSEHRSFSEANERCADLIAAAILNELTGGVDERR